MNFKKKLAQKQPLIGTLQELPATEVTEILALAGLDWLFVDMEHSAIDVSCMQHILQAGQKMCPCIVRSPSHDEVWLKKILDAGADGIIIPLVNSAEKAKEIIRFCKYPPAGSRSIGIARAQDYGMNFQKYVAEANEKVAVILQIEHIDAVRNIDAIVKVPGIDAIFIGPYDLSGSMGMTGQVNSPEVQQQIETVRKACIDAGLPMGIFTADPAEVKSLLEKGYSLIAVGIDAMILGKAAKEALKISKS
ncbi:MAG TPA: aldolase/citrate lyase family protein [Candidatus Kapabacteria bacterium]|nr:aldolase/citrate lyase family protein [Candidatus Kapabacteria bacterium]